MSLRCVINCIVAGLGILACDRRGPAPASESTSARLQTSSESTSTRLGHWPVLGESFILPPPPRAGTAAAASLTLCSRSDPLITPDSIGAVHLDQTVQGFFTWCPDAVGIWDPDGEGNLEPATYVRLGRSVVTVVFADTLRGSHVQRIEVSDSNARLRSGLGPGSPLLQVARELGTPDAVVVECGLWVSFQQTPGIAAWIAYPGEASCDRAATLERAINAGRTPTDVTSGGFRVFRPGA